MSEDKNQKPEEMEKQGVVRTEQEKQAAAKVKELSDKAQKPTPKEK